MTDYPKMIYHEDGRTAVVQSADQQSTLGGGWGDKPGEVHAQALNPSIVERVKPDSTRENVAIAGSPVLAAPAEVVVPPVTENTEATMIAHPVKRHGAMPVSKTPSATAKASEENDSHDR